jgi:enoyl-CoA hydratase
MNDVVTYRAEGAIATIAVDDGKVNALSFETLSLLQRGLDRAAEEKCDVVIVTGRPGVFSAGFDRNVLFAGGDHTRKMVKAGFETAERFLAFPRPIVVACTGHAIAMGSFLLLSADYRIGADGAFKIGANEVAIGLTMPRAAIEICRQRLSPAYLNRAVLTAEMYAPKQAVEAGFLDAIVPDQELANAVGAAAKVLAKLDLGAHAATKQRLRAEMLKSLRAAIEVDAAELANLT